MVRGLVALATASFICVGSSSAPSVAQTIPKNPQIEIAYVAPRSEKFQPIYKRLRDLQVFEILQQFLSPLRLPRKILVKADECGAMRMTYQGNAQAVICYEYILAMEQAAPSAATAPIADGRIAREGVIVGAFVNEVLSQVGLAIFDVLQIPVWGDINDAGDNVAALIMSQFGDAVAWRTLIGTSWFLAQRTYVGRGTFSEVVGASEAPRFYNYLCIAYASNPGNFGFLSGDIPKDRLGWCQQDYRKLVRSFKQTILPHVDAVRLKQIQSVDWIKLLQMARN
jgi:hypothetical protein